MHTRTLCAVGSGERHPATYLSCKQSGRTRLIYPSAEVQGTARQWARNHRQLLAVLEHLSEVNRDVLRQLTPSPRAHGSPMSAPVLADVIEQVRARAAAEAKAIVRAA